MLFCGRCQRAGREHRLILTEGKGRGGSYYYFLCRGRQEGVCDLSYLRVEGVEDAVEREYANLALPPDFAASVEARVSETMADEQRSTRQLKTNLNAELARLGSAEERLIDLAAEGALPVAKVRSRLTTLQQDRDRVRQQLDTLEQDLAEGAGALTAAVRLLDKPQQLFQTAGDTTRRLLTQTFFERLYIDEDDVTEVRYQEPFADMRDAARRWTVAMSSPSVDRRPGRRRAPAPTVPGLFHGGGPACSLPRPWTWVRVRRLWWRWRESNPRPSTQNQGFSERSPLRLCSAPPITRTSRCDGPSRCGVSRTYPRPARAVSHLADASIRADDEPGLTDSPSCYQAARAKSCCVSAALIRLQRVVNEIIVAFLGSLPLVIRPQSRPFTPCVVVRSG